MNTRPNNDGLIGEGSSNFWASIVDALHTFVVTAGATYLVYEVSTNILGVIAATIKAILFST